MVEAEGGCAVGGCAMGGGGRWVRWGGKDRRGVRGEREITVRESVNEKERAHEIPK